MREFVRSSQFLSDFGIIVALLAFQHFFANEVQKRNIRVILSLSWPPLVANNTFCYASLTWATSNLARQPKNGSRNKPSVEDVRDACCCKLQVDLLKNSQKLILPKMPITVRLIWLKLHPWSLFLTKTLLNRGYKISFLNFIFK
jgi:hypothetical protein